MFLWLKVLGLDDWMTLSTDHFTSFLGGTFLTYKKKLHEPHTLKSQRSAANMLPACVTSS